MKNRKFLTKILTVLLSTAIVFSGTGMQTMAAASTDGDVTAVDVLATEEVSENSIEKEAEEAKEIPAQTVAEDETGLNLEGATAADYGLEIPDGDGFKTYTVNKGDRVTLSSTATANPGVELVYSWSGTKYNPQTDSDETIDFSGVATRSYADIYNTCSYIYCTATVKGTNISVWQSYSVNIDAHFNISGITKDENGNYEKDITVVYGSTSTLTVNATVDSDALPLEYSWSGTEYSTATSSGVDMRLDNTTNSIVTATANVHHRFYSCRIKDKYGNYYLIHYNVKPDTGLTIYDEDGKPTVYSNREITVDPLLDQMTITSSATANQGITLTYLWKRNGNGEDITIGNTRTITLPRDTKSYDCVRCTISDNLGNTVIEVFWVNVDTGLQIPSPNLETEYDKYNTISDYAPVFVNKGENTLLESRAVANDGIALTRKWYKKNSNVIGDYEYTAISGATGSRYTTPSINEFNEFKCVTTDGYGNDTIEYYTVSIDSGLHLEKQEVKYVYGAINQRLTLQSVAVANVSEQITYKWYKEIETVDYEYQLLGSKSVNTFDITFAEKSTIICKAYDQYGNSTEEHFILCLNTGVGGTEISRTIQNINMSCRTGMVLNPGYTSTRGPIEYSWYSVSEAFLLSDKFTIDVNEPDDVYECIAYDTDKVATTPTYNVTKNGYYLVSVSDQENRDYVIYHVTKPAAATHSFGAWTVKTAATTSAAGVETRTCSVCGNSETREIPKLTGSKADAKITIKNGKKKVSKVSVAKGKSVKLTLEVEPKDVKATLVKLDKKSAKIAKVSLKNGKLTIKGKSKGKVTVKIKYGEKTKSFKVTVK